ncbi:hypothetical protein [Spartinivicinus ruber]|uniref:hypothetical protein n=1 Tax=Spartinivicinus ruber TaxID=2683272 RepID=UPI0013D26059|nr:hypothetical protein [Spartinivicinus ruber]
MIPIASEVDLTKAELQIASNREISYKSMGDLNGLNEVNKIDALPKLYRFLLSSLPLSMNDIFNNYKKQAAKWIEMIESNDNIPDDYKEEIIGNIKFSEKVVLENYSYSKKMANLAFCKNLVSGISTKINELTRVS